jgi:hypothetical protein
MVKGSGTGWSAWECLQLQWTEDGRKCGASVDVEGRRGDRLDSVWDGTTIHRYLHSKIGIGTGIGIGPGIGPGIGIRIGTGIGAGIGTGIGTGIRIGTGIGAGIGTGIGTRIGIGTGIGTRIGIGTGIGKGTGTGIGTWVAAPVAEHEHEESLSRLPIASYQTSSRIPCNSIGITDKRQHLVLQCMSNAVQCYC